MLQISTSRCIRISFISFSCSSCDSKSFKSSSIDEFPLWRRYILFISLSKILCLGLFSFSGKRSSSWSIIFTLWRSYATTRPVLRFLLCIHSSRQLEKSNVFFWSFLTRITFRSIAIDAFWSLSRKGPRTLTNLTKASRLTTSIDSSRWPCWNRDARSTWRNRPEISRWSFCDFDRPS